MKKTESKKHGIQVSYEQLEAEHEQLKAIMAAVGEGLVVLNKKRQILYMNKTAGSLLAIDPRRAIGKHYSDIVSLHRETGDVVEIEKPIHKVLETGDTLAADLKDDMYYVLSSGKRFPVSFTAAPLRIHDKISGAVIVFRDMTAMKKFDEAKTNFISIASHQIRTPVTAIRWYTELLLDAQKTAAPTKEQSEFSKEIYSSVLRLVDMLNTLLYLTKAETGQLVIKPQAINLSAFVRDITKELKTALESKTLSIGIGQSAAKISITIDPIILRQVISNLLINAINYSDEGGIIEISFAQNKDTVTVAIRDQGVGIPRNQQSKIFGRFFRASNASIKAPGGTGLGLFLVKYLVELWGGKIWFESPASWNKNGKVWKKGTAFFFTIPRRGK